MLYRYLKIFLVQIIVLDFICLNGIFFLAGFGLRQYDLQVHQGADALLLVSNIAWAISLYTSGLYSVSQQLSYEKMARKTAHSVLMYLLILLLFLFLYQQLYSRFFVMMYCSMFIIAVVINRLLFYWITDSIRRSKGVERKMVILGYNEMSKQLADNLLARVQYLSDKLVSGFKQALAGNNKVVDIRGKGLMIGIELNAPCPELVEKGRAKGILINVTSVNTIRLLPTFILTDAEAEELITKVVELVTEF